VDRFYPSEIDGDAVMKGEPFLIQAGRPPGAAVVALPLNRWRENVAVSESYDLQKAPRIGLSDLTAGIIVRIVVAQVDADWKPKGCAILTFSGHEVMLLVPYNDFWAVQVERGGEEQ
jgi:hypothetical protein